MPSYTPRQHDVMLILKQSMQERGVAPTLEEVAERMGGISRVAAFHHLRALERKRAIRRRAHASRGIEILDRAYLPERGLLLAGRIAAGEPILEVEDREEISLVDYLRADEGCFLLRVQGDSMIEDHIVDGDLVLVESRSTAREGQTVVAVVEGETTLKRFHAEGGQIRLEPANRALQPRTYPAHQVQIRGVLRGVIRRR